MPLYKSCCNILNKKFYNYNSYYSRFDMKTHTMCSILFYNLDNMILNTKFYIPSNSLAANFHLNLSCCYHSENHRGYTKTIWQDQRLSFPILAGHPWLLF